MKIIVPFFASLFLAAMTFAQEESPAPSESTAPTSEEKASATVETTPEVSTSEATAPASKKAEESMATPAPAKAAKTEAPAATASSAKPAAAAKPAATTAAAPKMNAKNMSVKDMENAWEAAVAKHDYATMDGFIAADFAGVSAKNKFVGRADVLAESKRDKDTYKSAKNEKLNVKTYGPNLTVVTGRAREVGTGKDGKAFDRTYLFTDTWMLRGGKWQCVASQITKIKG